MKQVFHTIDYYSQGSAKSKYQWIFGSLDPENLIQYVLFWIWIKSSWSNFYFLDFDQVELIQYFLYWIWINSSWSNFLFLDFNQVELIQYFFYWIWIKWNWSNFFFCILNKSSWSNIWKLNILEKVELIVTILFPVSYTTKMLGIRITESRVSSESSSSSEDEESSVFYNIEEEEDYKT